MTFGEQVRAHPEVVKAADELAKAVLRAVEGLAVAAIKTALPFPFSLAAPFVAPALEKAESFAETALDAEVAKLTAPVSESPAVAPPVPAAALQAAGSQGWRNQASAQRASEPDPTDRKVEGEGTMPDAGGAP